MNLKKFLVTFSWDDGHPLDLRIAQIFNKHNLRCTFYVPKINSENLPTLTASDLQSLSKDNFDIHSHTLNHVYLNGLSIDRQVVEIQSGKKYVEDLTGKEDNIFCYPGGKYNQQTIEIVKNAGFEFARTVDMGFKCAYSTNNYLMPTTAIVAPLTIAQIVKHSLKRFAVNRAFDIYKFNRAIINKNWNEQLKGSGSTNCYHFWGHSWEVEKYDLWVCLESLLETLIASNANIVTNDEFYQQGTSANAATNR